MTRGPIIDPPKGLRQRQRADGKWRLWWEPTPAARELGFEPIELDASRPTWSVRRAQKINDDVAAARGGARATPQARTISDLILSYTRSPRFLDRLSDATRRDYVLAFRIIREKWGNARVAEITKPVMSEWYDTLYADTGKSAAKAYLAKMSVLMTYAEIKGWCPVNPCLRLQMVTPKKRNRVASWSEQDALVAAADKLGRWSVGTAILLSAFHGQRVTDVLAVTWKHLEGDRLMLIQSKHGSAVSMKLNPEVVQRLSSRRYDDTATAVCLFEGTGRPYSDLTQFSGAFRRVRKLAAQSCPSVYDIQFRDLRRTFNARAAAGGANAKDRADAMGNQIDINPALEMTYNPPTTAAADAAAAAAARPDPKRKQA
ncbi:hypothetical protein [Roseobacter sp. N2S]|uniref:tyrosine-type recombinase/integrase n=1 Tax=Roseobacter sp. N2S TaxID=2663844 RepID=UPI0028598346|nr:hypothetical protein [Roseobacter sp. N2S]MDR6266567.1 integrase [Roseobacter sp. N2S]